MATIDANTQLRKIFTDARKHPELGAEPRQKTAPVAVAELGAEPRQKVQAGKLTVQEFQGMVTIHGLNYTDGARDDATASLDTFGEVHLNSFKREHLLALAEVATYAAARAEPLPEAS